MRSVHHLYPYPPWGWHGGTLRLRTALEASDLIASGTLSWWDRSESCWHEASPEIVGSPDPGRLETRHFDDDAGLKRRLFPSTLWESGIRPRRAMTPAVEAHADATLVLHTTYLAPMARTLRRRGWRVVVDVHDAVFRAHRDDARRASGGLRVVRRSYAASVKVREAHSLRAADGLAVAGWDDASLLAGLGLTEAVWAPTGVEADLSPAPPHDRLCVGLIGNFAHSATATAASEVLRSPLASDPSVQLLFAGLGSESWANSRGAIALGPVSRVNEFYDRVHATVVPVTNGSGMKCKLAEAALAGKAVITTPLGAAGYPPSLRAAFVIVERASLLSSSVVADAVSRVTPQTLREQFWPLVGREAAAATYAELLRGAAR